MKYTRKEIIEALEKAMEEHAFDPLMKDMLIASLDFYLEKDEKKAN